MCQLIIRKVGALGDRAKKQAEEKGLDDDDIVAVETEIHEHKPPGYEITKIEGSPTEFLLEKILESKENTGEE